MFNVILILLILPIADLSSPDYTTREKEQARLISQGYSAIKPLIKATETETDLEFIYRAEFIINKYYEQITYVDISLYYLPAIYRFKNGEDVYAKYLARGVLSDLSNAEVVASKFYFYDLLSEADNREKMKEIIKQMRSNKEELDRLFLDNFSLWITLDWNAPIEKNLEKLRKNK